MVGPGPRGPRPAPEVPGLPAVPGGRSDREAGVAVITIDWIGLVGYDIGYHNGVRDTLATLPHPPGLDR